MSPGYLDLDAAGYDDGFARWTRRLAEPFLDFVGPARGLRVLEAGAGTGSLTRAVLARLGDGELHACDLSSRYVAVLHRRIADSRLHLHVSDAARLPLPDGGFDLSISLLMLNFAGPEAVAEMTRVLGAGGRFAAGVLDLRNTGLLMRRFFDRAAALSPEAARLRQEILGLPLGNPARAVAECRLAGLAEVTRTSFALPMDYESFADCWALLSAAQGPTGAIAACLPTASRAALEAELRQAYLDGRPDGPRRETIDAWAVKGRLAAA